MTAVKKMFIDAATTTSASLVKGLVKDALESVSSNLLGQVTDHNIRDCAPGPQSTVIFLVDGYDDAKTNASSVGVLTVVWNLVVKDYKEKKKIPLHETTLSIRTHAVLYSSLDPMFADKLTVIVLYAPNLQNIGSIDNGLSDTTTIYTKSVTTGFTFSASQSIGTEAVFEASIIIADAKVGFTLTFSVTEEWSTSTESMSFSVPPGKKAFTYQGYVMAKHLIFDAKSGSYAYGSGAQQCPRHDHRSDGL